MEAVLELDVSTALDAPVAVPANVLAADFGDAAKAAFKAQTPLVVSCDVARIAALVDVVLALIAADRCPPGTAHLLLESAVESLPLFAVKDLWRVFVSRKASLLDNIQATRPPGTTLLRTLVALEKRVSPVLDPGFCVDISLYLFDAFGFPVRALINLKSLPVPAPALDVDHGSEDYNAFWALIADVQNAPALCKNERTFKSHLSRAARVVRLFTANPPPRKTASAVAPRTLAWETDPELFDAFAADAKVQRLVSLQNLVAIEVVLRHDRQDDEPKLPAELLDTLKTLKNRWFRILLGLSREHEMEVYKHFMLTERDWVAWKAAGGKPLPVAAHSATAAQAELKLGTLSGRNRMLSPALQALWDTPAPLSETAEPNVDAELRAKYGVPLDAAVPNGFERYFEFYESEYETEMKSGWRWLALRLMLGNVDFAAIAATATKLGATYFDDAVVDAINAALPAADAELPDYNRLSGTKRTADGEPVKRQSAFAAETPRNVDSDSEAASDSDRETADGDESDSETEPAGPGSDRAGTEPSEFVTESERAESVPVSEQAESERDSVQAESDQESVPETAESDRESVPETAESDREESVVPGPTSPAFEMDQS